MAGKGGGRDYGSSVRIRAHAFKVLAPEPLVGSILGGRGGITQKEEIQNDTGARLTLSNRDEHYPHSRLRLIIVHADESGQVLSALDRLVDKVVECGSMEREGSRGEGEFLGSKPGEIVFRVALPSVIDDRVIGRNGEGLLQLADETGARVTADHEFYDGHFMVQLVGVTDVIRQCLDRLMAEVDTVSGEEPFAQWAAVRAFPGSGGGGGGHSGGHSGGPTSGAVGAPPPRRDPPDNRDARRPAPEPVSSSRYSERGGGIGSSSRSGRPSLDDSSLRPVGEPPSSSSYGMGNNSDHGYGGRPRSQAPTGSSGGRSERGRSNDIGGGGGGGGRKSAAIAAAVPQNPMLEAMSLIAELFPEGGLDVDYLITCELPARRCGALIGKKGDYVDYVERMSGCKIKFDAEDKQGPGDSTRRLTITGKLLGVYVSHALMMKRFLDTEANERLRSEDDNLRPQLEALHQSWASGSSVRGRGTSAPADRPTLGLASGTGDRDRESLRDRGGGGGISSSQRDNEGDSYDIERLKRLRRTALEAGYITDGRAPVAGDRHRSGQRPRGSSDHDRSERRSRSRRQSSRGRSRGAYPPAEPSRSGERHRDDGMRHQPRESDHHMSTSQRRQFPDRSGAQQEAPPSYEAEPRRERERYRDQAPQQQPRQQQQQQQQQQQMQQQQMQQQPQMQQPQMQPPQMQQPQLPEMRTADATVSAFLRYVFGANEVLTVQDANGTRAMGRYLPPPISSWDDAIAKGYISTTVRSGLVAAGMTYPTPVQNQIVPLVAAPAAVDVLIEAPAGCGKTFGVVLPLVARLAARTPPLRPHMPGSPAAVAPLMLVLLPNRDVASHVGQRVRDVAMSAHPDLKVLTLSGGDDLPMQIQAIERNQFDILCATPETLRHCINAGMLKLGFLQSIVLDDADQLLEVPHLQVIEQLFNSPELPAQDRQTVFIARFFFEELAVAATQLVRRVPELAALQAALDAPAAADTHHGGGHPEGESLVEHRVGWISNVEELWESLGQDVGELLQGCNPSCRRLLVFVNSFEQTQAVANYLRQDPHRLNCLEWPVGLGAEAQQAAMQSVYNSPSCVIVVAHGDSIALDLQALQAAGAGAILQMELPRAIDSYHGRVACLAAGVALSYATERDEALLPDVRQAMLDAGSQAPLWMSSSAESW